MRRRITGRRQVHRIARLWRDREPLPDLARALGYRLPPLDDAEAWQRLRRRCNTSIKRLRKRHGPRLFPFRWHKSQSLEQAALECRQTGAVPRWALDAAREPEESPGLAGDEVAAGSSEEAS